MGTVLFVAKGNYGSKVFDPVGDRLQLRAAVCDGCVLKNVSRFVGAKITATEYDTVFLSSAEVLRLSR
jgi:hypothetical protein